MVSTWLDSGANESMFKESTGLANKLMSASTRIGTANTGSILQATHKRGKLICIPAMVTAFN